MSPQPTFYRIPKDSNLRWITLFYNMPRELVEKRPEFLNMPRKIREVFKSEKWMNLINTDVFLELIWDCYAWTGWQFFQVPDPKGGYMDIPGTWGHYSGDFPMWRYAYMLPALILQQLEQLPGQDIQSLLLRPKEFEVPWVSYEVFYSVIGRLTQSIVETMKWQPIFDEIWNNRAHEDYNGSNSKQRDFLRSWNHTRKPEAETTVEKVADSGMTVGKKVSYDLTDKSEPMEEQVAQKDYIARFEDTLSERDKKILQLRMENLSMAEIAKQTGYSNAGAVSKRIQQIAIQFEKYQAAQDGK